MLFGLASVVDMSNSNSTLIDPIVLQDRAEKAQAQSQAAALASQQAQQKASETASQKNVALMFGTVSAAGLLWWFNKNHGKGAKT